MMLIKMLMRQYKKNREKPRFMFSGHKIGWQS